MNVSENLVRLRALVAAMISQRPILHRHPRSELKAGASKHRGSHQRAHRRRGRARLVKRSRWVNTHRGQNRRIPTALR